MITFPNISLLRKKPGFMGNKNGAALIEFAFIAPVLLLLIVGAMEYGIYFLNSMSSSRALSASTQLVMQDPTDPDNQSFANRDLAFGDHKVCAKAYPTLAAAEANAGTCSDGEWATAAPVGSSGDYYIAMSASGEGKSITGLFSTFLPSIKHNEVVKVSSGNNASNGTCPGERTPKEYVEYIQDGFYLSYPNTAALAEADIGIVCDPTAPANAGSPGGYLYVTPCGAVRGGNSMLCGAPDIN